jgi:hypothetical protein
MAHEIKQLKPKTGGLTGRCRGSKAAMPALKKTTKTI